MRLGPAGLDTLIIDDAADDANDLLVSALDAVGLVSVDDGDDVSDA